MVIIAKALDKKLDGYRLGYYAKVIDKESIEGFSHIIFEDGIGYKIEPETLKMFTGIYTGKAQPIYEGDTIEVFDDAESYVGTVAYVRELAGFYLFETASGEWREIVGDDRYFV